MQKIVKNRQQNAEIGRTQTIKDCQKILKLIFWNTNRALILYFYRNFVNTNLYFMVLIIICNKLLFFITTSFFLIFAIIFPS